MLSAKGRLTNSQSQTSGSGSKSQSILLNSKNEENYRSFYEEKKPQTPEIEDFDLEEVVACSNVSDSLTEKDICDIHRYLRVPLINNTKRKTKIESESHVPEINQVFFEYFSEAKLRFRTSGGLIFGLEREEYSLSKEEGTVTLFSIERMEPVLKNYQFTIGQASCLPFFTYEIESWINKDYWIIVVTNRKDTIHRLVVIHLPTFSILHNEASKDGWNRIIKVFHFENGRLTFLCREKTQDVRIGMYLSIFEISSQIFSTHLEIPYNSLVHHQNDQVYFMKFKDRENHQRAFLVQFNTKNGETKEVDLNIKGMAKGFHCVAIVKLANFIVV